MERGRARWRGRSWLSAIDTILAKIGQKSLVGCAALAVLMATVTGRPALAWAPDNTIWTKPLAIKGFGGAYASILKLGPQVMMFSNHSMKAKSAPCPGASCPGIVLYTGNTTTNVTQAAVVAPNAMINDVFTAGTTTLAPKRMFTRPVVARSVKDNKFYAVAHVADDYPPGPSGVYPAFLSSPDGRKWTYHGRFKGEPAALGRVWGSGMAFLVNDGAGPLDTVNPLNNKFVFIEDSMAGRKLSLLYSADGLSWRFARDAAGAVRELAPPELLGESVIFPSVAKTPKGYHMITSKNWPVTAQRHLFSCDGLTWTLLGSPGSKGATFLSPGGKNTNLSYDAASSTVLALESYLTGSYYAKKLASFLPAPVPCP
jgi:hypothetical protein